MAVSSCGASLLSMPSSSLYLLYWSNSIGFFSSGKITNLHRLLGRSGNTWLAGSFYLPCSCFTSLSKASWVYIPHQTAVFGFLWALQLWELASWLALLPHSSCAQNSKWARVEKSWPTWPAVLQFSYSFQPVPCYCTETTNTKTRSRKRLSVNHWCRQA